jgi:soluble lytic murein transglycosylase-like protein
MRKRLQITLTATLTAISFLSTLFLTVPARAQSGAQAGARTGAITSTSDESGRKIYVNEDKVNGYGPSSAASRPDASTRSRSPLVYWSVTEHRFKPVPTSGAVMRAARTAASEVNTYLDGRTQTQQTLNGAFTAQDIDAAIDRAAARHNVDPSLVRSVVKVESNFNPNAVSRKGAMGLMQLMPSTARSLNVSNPFDPQQNVDAGVRHLRRLLDSYGGDVRLSLAAYNAGSGAVARSAGVPHFRETQNYVRRITNLYNGGSEQGSYIFGSPVHEPVHVQRDARGVLHISNTE